MKITLKKKKLQNGRNSYYIEFYKGSIRDENGKLKHNRSFEYLKLYEFIEPKSAIEKKKNKESLITAQEILAIRKADFIQGKYGIQNGNKGRVRLLDYYAKVKDEKKKESSLSNYNTWHSTEKYLIRYCPNHITMADVDKDFVKGFKSYLDNDARSVNGLRLAQNSKYTYFNKFRSALKEAYENGYLSENFGYKVKSFQEQESQREYLTIDELKAISLTDCKYPVLKRAFIFSCLTGLRWSDIFKMKWDEVREEGKDENGIEVNRIVFKQQKTDGMEYLYISQQARDLLGVRQLNSERVFVGLRYGTTFNSAILRWMQLSGIRKHITFHSARHTNAVLLLENGADIYTVQKRLGHKEIRTTEIYAKIIDKKMKEAGNIIPKIDITL